MLIVLKGFLNVIKYLKGIELLMEIFDESDKV